MPIWTEANTIWVDLNKSKGARGKRAHIDTRKRICCRQSSKAVPIKGYEKGICVRTGHICVRIAFCVCVLRVSFCFLHVESAFCMRFSVLVCLWGDSRFAFWMRA